MGFVDESPATSRPYRSALREEQAERTKLLIARAARERFVDTGWAGTSVRSVATAAGVSEATVYAVYGTKAGLAVTLVDSADAAADVERVLAIWRETRRRHGGAAPFLFGDFGIADAMYAPVVLRFVSHGISLDGDAQDYAAAITDLQALRDWLDEAATEPLSDVHERMKP